MNSKIVFLTNSFYKDHPNPPFKNKCGIDYSKAIVVDKPEYIDQQVRPHLRQNEYEALRGNEFAVQKGLAAGAGSQCVEPRLGLDRSRPPGA